MKILFLSKEYPPNLVGGVGTYVFEISRLLAKSGHQVFVITKAEDLELDYLDAGVRVFNVRPKKISALESLRYYLKGTLERLEYSIAVSRKIKELVVRFRIDIIESCEARAEGLWYYLFHKKPALVIKLHTPETLVFKLDHPPFFLDYALMKLLEEYWLSMAAQKIGISTEVVELTARHFSLKSKDIPIVPNPFDITGFKPAENGSLNGTLEILYVGRLEFRKGPHILMRAFEYVQEEIPQARLTFIGDDCGMKTYLIQRVSRLRYPEQVDFLEHLPRNSLPDYYRRSSVCIIPSLWENYPYVCLEAMSCAKPVIASAVGGLKDMVKQRNNGILFSPGSARQLSEEIISLLKDEKLRTRLGRQARIDMEENFAPEIIAKKTAAIYERVLKG